MSSFRLIFLVAMLMQVRRKTLLCRSKQPKTKSFCFSSFAFYHRLELVLLPIVGFSRWTNSTRPTIFKATLNCSMHRFRKMFESKKRFEPVFTSETKIERKNFSANRTIFKMLTVFKVCGRCPVDVETQWKNKPTRKIVASWNFLLFSLKTFNRFSNKKSSLFDQRIVLIRRHLNFVIYFSFRLNTSFESVEDQRWALIFELVEWKTSKRID